MSLLTLVLPDRRTMKVMNTSDDRVITTLRRTLLELARAEDDRAAREAATVPYWSPCPASVQGHRAAADALRLAADAVLHTV